MQARPKRLLRGLLIMAAGIGVIAALRIADGGAPDSLALTGRTMGTSWSVKVVPQPAAGEAAALEAAIAATLDRINGRMSTWLEASEVSRFNAHDGEDWFPVSAETRDVVAAALAASRRTDGAFDITVGPLVDLWGFGPEDVLDAPPATEIEAARARVGWERIAIRDEPPALSKSNPQTRIDLSAIAKGYAVDEVAAVLEGAGLANYLVEVGGELRTRGHNAAGRPWRVAVEKPVPGNRAMQRVIALQGGGVATSGDYRNVIVLDGKRYGHAIDPRTGHPVPRGVASATVIGESAMEADALATALLVMGPEQAQAFVDREGLAVLLLVHGEDGVHEIASTAFAAHMLELGANR